MLIKQGLSGKRLDLGDPPLRPKELEFMAEGRIKWYNRKKGFGFIENSVGPDIFLHFSQIEGDTSRPLLEGDVVEYESIPGEKGPKAIKVIRKDSVSKA